MQRSPRTGCVPRALAILLAAVLTLALVPGVGHGVEQELRDARQELRETRAEISATTSFVAGSIRTREPVHSPAPSVGSVIATAQTAVGSALGTSR